MTTSRHASTLIFFASLLALSACGPPGENKPPVGNKPPIAQDDIFSLVKNTSLDLDVLSNDSDEDGDSLSIVGFDETSTQAGRVVRAGTGLRYTPEAAFIGTDMFTYLIGDGKAQRLRQPLPSPSTKVTPTTRRQASSLSVTRW